MGVQAVVVVEEAMDGDHVERKQPPDGRLACQIRSDLLLRAALSPLRDRPPSRLHNIASSIIRHRDAGRSEHAAAGTTGKPMTVARSAPHKAAAAASICFKVIPDSGGGIYVEVRQPDQLSR